MARAAAADVERIANLKTVLKTANDLENIQHPQVNR